MIKYIGLHNFKCWADEEVSLGALTLLTGLNGTGKSTLLQALLALRQSHDQGLLADGRLAINGDLVTLGTARDVFCEDAKDDFVTLALGWLDGRQRHWSFRYDRTADVLEPDPDAAGLAATETAVSTMPGVPGGWPPPGHDQPPFGE